MKVVIIENGNAEVLETALRTLRPGAEIARITSGIDGSIQAIEANPDRDLIIALKSRLTADKPKILLERGIDTLIVNAEDICYIFTSKGNTRVYLSDGTWGATDKTLVDLSKILPSSQFCRVSRQAIVNTDYVARIIPGPGRDSKIVMKAPFESTVFKITQDRKKKLMGVLSGLKCF